MNYSDAKIQLIQRKKVLSVLLVLKSLVTSCKIVLKDRLQISNIEQI